MEVFSETPFPILTTLEPPGMNLGPSEETPQLTTNTPELRVGDSGDSGV